jgi:TRAP transporter TAXI family solute receptor
MGTPARACAVVAAALVAAACGTGEPRASAAPLIRIRVVHGWGLDSPYTKPIESALNAAMPPGLHVELRGTNASITNVMLLQAREADAVFTFSDAAYMASIGQLPEMPQRFDQIRAIAELPTRALQVVVAPGSRIRSLGGLRGRHVSLGPSGSGANLTATVALAAFGMSLGDLRAERLEFADAARLVESGGLDAAFWNGTFPNVNIANATRRGATLLEIAGTDIDQFRAEYPFLRPVVIPAGTYPGIPAAVHTVGVDGILVCRADLDETIVHDLTRAFFETVTQADVHVQPLAHLNVSRAPSTAIPLHPGAARYYRERELLR